MCACLVLRGWAKERLVFIPLKPNPNWLPNIGFPPNRQLYTSWIFTPSWPPEGALPLQEMKFSSK
uniref:Uncharacterized protein n=1 Tax=Anguilla anguilla TaxID=7936 RepID=A0A0E9XL52_ANGAN